MISRIQRVQQEYRISDMPQPPHLQEMTFCHGPDLPAGLQKGQKDDPDSVHILLEILPDIQECSGQNEYLFFLPGKQLDRSPERHNCFQSLRNSLASWRTWTE